jgi:hypothetical protein
MTLYMGGRQIFETSQEVQRYIREEDSKSNKQVMDKLLMASSRSNLFFLNARVSFLFCRGGAPPYLAIAPQNPLKY